ncbi:hypothetical protein HMPREF1042_0369 [Streptococcus constellatus subsp. pharyngis SK1060 = CCUG 46377]|uniref:Uncharacterized protein n=1 Tax=Streptococcus constellatus subsp. pharyngis SK1060 = CCUG 46377 TaxID=1035184 RepID=F9P4H2_STRCV|nr:hypothetical protein HMPREF1042_0369 [Streptococcus constellatus subsp. pharyngis SK1060 = CCUG 46377]
MQMLVEWIQQNKKLELFHSLDTFLILLYQKLSKIPPTKV